MRYRLAIFDFDGTLADSFPFFLRVFNQLARQHGFKEIDPEQAAPLRGYTARQMMSHVGLPSWKLPLVAARKVGVAFGAASWGYGTIESMRALAPEEEFDCVADMKRIA